MLENQAEMPKYKSHREVWALKIAAAEVNKDGSVTIAPADEGFAAFTTSPDFGLRFKGNDKDLGYYIAYRDGYKSWCPSVEFEDGYSRI